MFAEPHELGFDPTMVPHRASDGSIQYDISVQSLGKEPSVYRTIGVLYDGGYGSPFGRATRVWKAKRLSATGEMMGESVALKECWVTPHREREGDISAGIRKSSVSLESEDYEQLNELLLTVLDHGDVYVVGSLDCTKNLPEVITKESSERVHYRIVHAEVGIPLHEETSLQVIFLALVDVCGGA